MSDSGTDTASSIVSSTGTHRKRQTRAWQAAVPGSGKIPMYRNLADYQAVWTPENHDHQQRSCKCMSLKEQCRPFSAGCLTFLRFFAQISDHHLKQTHCKYIISCKHNPGDQQMERIHKDQIPGVGVAEAIPKYQKKSCQYRHGTL